MYHKHWSQSKLWIKALPRKLCNWFIFNHFHFIHRFFFSWVWSSDYFFIYIFKSKTLILKLYKASTKPNLSKLFNCRDFCYQKKKKKIEGITTFRFHILMNQQNNITEPCTTISISWLDLCSLPTKLPNFRILTHIHE